MNRAAVIEQLKQTQEILARLLALLEAGEADKFAAHLYQARRNTGAPPSDRTKATRLSSARFSQVTRSRRVLDSMVTFAPGNTCCGFTSEVMAFR
jgi:primosomal protein N'